MRAAPEASEGAGCDNLPQGCDRIMRMICGYNRRRVGRAQSRSSRVQMPPCSSRTGNLATGE